MQTHRACFAPARPAVAPYQIYTGFVRGGGVERALGVMGGRIIGVGVTMQLRDFGLRS
jgi:hypothetical protein